MKKLFIFFAIIFHANLAFGYFSENIIDGCGTLLSDNMRAAFQINEYTCANGYFLPADTLGCVACPIDATCSGGTYQYNETFEQGRTRNTLMTQNQPNACSYGYKKMFAIFQISQYDCAPGYYLPANATACVMCPADSYCPGGTYTFNETVTQGIVSCASGLFAPAGMRESAQCGRILHVGDGFVYLRATKKTSPSLHLDLDHDGVADYFGNMTTLDVPMSRDTQRKLKVRYNNTTYSVYDDSVELNQYQN
jgi:hypothetical protein